MIKLIRLALILIGAVSLGYSLYFLFDYYNFVRHAVTTRGTVRSFQIKENDIGSPPGVVGKYSMMRGHFGGPRIIRRPLYTVEFQDTSGRLQTGTLLGSDWLTEGAKIEFSYLPDNPNYLRQPEREFILPTFALFFAGGILFMSLGQVGTKIRRTNGR
jgi:hypothetical protein